MVIAETILLLAAVLFCLLFPKRRRALSSELSLKHFYWISAALFLLALGLRLFRFCLLYTSAYDRLPQICQSNHINYVLGIELSALWNYESIHMLAYHFDRDNVQMKTYISKQYSNIECEYILSLIHI